jgi:uncharacterized membrane protein YcaP (DUF421 family)
MSLSAIAIRALFAFLFLFLMLRLSGKRTIGQATPLDLVVALILGDMIDDLLWAEVSAARFVVATGVLMLCHIALSAAATASPGFGKLVHGVPVEVVRAGSLVKAGMRRERVNEQEVAALLRQNSIADEREVKIGTLEVSGELGIIEQEWAKEAQKRDLERVREVAR